MKIAIIGNGPQAIITTNYFIDLGAEVKLFYEDQNLNAQLEAVDIYTNKFENLLSKFEELGVVKSAKVLRVQKRTLKPGVMPQNGQSRLSDLFRVIYRMKISEDFIDAQNENSQIYEKLGSEVVNSLKDAIESYEDFDIVINATGGTQTPMPMGAANSHAVNELAVASKSAVYYGMQKLKLIDSDLEKLNNVTIVGDDFSNLLFLKKIIKIFKNKPNFKINLITDSVNPFVDSTPDDFKNFLVDFNNLLNLNQEEFDEGIQNFTSKIMEWRDLDDFVKVKVPKPAEPMSRLTIYNGAVISSVDKLLDQEGIFLTMEGSELLGTREILKTISTELILVGNGFKKIDEFEYTLELKIDNEKSETTNEPGYYRIRNFDFMKTEASCKVIEDDLMKFFSRACV